MKYIDEKFKDAKPEETVNLIKGILTDLGITLTERWNETGIDDCWALRVTDQCGEHGTNGKGVSKNFAMASAYAEFMERLSLGIFFRTKQYAPDDPSLNLNSFAPDARYMTEQELIDNGEWMDHIINEYGHGLSREKIAKLCTVFDGNKSVLTVPYYSLFEDKYVYIPTALESKLYTANGCCAGNSRNEAWIHGLSEIFERHNCLLHLISGKSAPVIPYEKLKKYSTVSRILDKIKEKDNFDVTVFDLSLGTGFPVIATRTIDKITHSYKVNVGADPVVEIAIQRTLTETFQGESLNGFRTYCTRIPSDIKEVTAANNIMNQMVSAQGIFTADFFSEELNNSESAFDFADNSEKNNVELLQYMLGIYRKLGKPVYVRNASYLGFPCYRFIVPGFSESRIMHLTNPSQHYGIGIEAAKSLRNIRNATDDDLAILFINRNIIKGVISQENNFHRLSGVPVVSCDSAFLLHMHYAYASYRLGRNADCLVYLKNASIFARDNDNKDYAACARQYMEFAFADRHIDEIMLILGKFYRKDIVSRLKENLSKYGDVFGDILVKCDFKNCDGCSLKSVCHLNESKRIIAAAGAKYSQFVDGQNKENFKI